MLSKILSMQYTLLTTFWEISNGLMLKKKKKKKKMQDKFLWYMKYVRALRLAMVLRWCKFVKTQTYKFSHLLFVEEAGRLLLY